VPKVSDIATLRYVKCCYVCGNDKNFSMIYQEKNTATEPTYWRIPEEIYLQMRCKKCGLLFVDSVIDDEYIKINHQGEIRSWDVIEDMLETFEKQRYPSLRVCINRISKHKNKLSGNKLFDVGCSLGTFLSLAKSDGFDVYGVDLAPEFIEYVKKNITKNAHCGFLDEIDFSQEFFDVITFWETMEHMADIRRFLFNVNSILKNDGIIAFSVPTSHYVLMKIFLFEKFFSKLGLTNRFSLRDKLLIQSHVYSFSTKSLKILLKSTNFEIVEILPLGKASIKTKGSLYNFGISILNKLSQILFFVSHGKIALSLSIFVIAEKVN
jgi:2-polyprenyl-3-methyl-5-hydroxy-6-metoxy-1,4-benzoquinol methylase